MTEDVLPPDDSSDHTPVPNRYAAVQTDAGDLVVFDAEDADAWIQSSDATCLTDHR